MPVPKVDAVSYADSKRHYLIFPLIVYLGASGQVSANSTGLRVSKFLGDLSYPLYITHYPVVYVYYAWVVNNQVPMEKAYPVMLLVFAVLIALAYLCLKYYDLPVRRWLAGKFLSDTKRQ